MASKNQIMLGTVPIGGGAPVAVQTMTKTETANLQATMAQIHTVAEAGADIVRRFGGLVDRVSFYTPGLVDPFRLATLIAAIREEGAAAAG